MSRIFILLCMLVLVSSSHAYALNYALQFDGINDFVKVPDSNSLDVSTGITIEAWIKSADTSDSKSIVTKWHDSVSDWSYILKSGHGSGKLSIELSKDFHNDLANLPGNSSIVAGDWTHVSATYDGSKVKLYLNSVQDGIISATGNIDSSLAELFIGQVYDSGENFSGLIDEVRIWNYARTEQELQDWMYYSLTGNENGLVGYWNFDDGIGQIAHDSSIYGNNGQLGSTSDSDTNDPRWILSDGVYGQSQTAVPEPATLSLVGLGILGLISRRKR